MVQLHDNKRDKCKEQIAFLSKKLKLVPSALSLKKIIVVKSLLNLIKLNKLVYLAASLKKIIRWWAAISNIQL